MSNEMTGVIKPGSIGKDFPKVEGAPKPLEVSVWTAYILDGRMHARMHVPGKFHEFQFDCVIDNPENFCQVVDNFRAGRP